MEIEYRVKSDKTFEQACDSVRDAVSERGFGVLAEIKTGDILTSKGFEYPRMNTYEVCNPEYAHAVLERDQRFESMLPCKIVVKEKGEGTEIIALLPEPMIHLVGTESIKDVMMAAQKILINIVDDIAI
jgi:Uncharacterized conserved protein